MRSALYEEGIQVIAPDIPVSPLQARTFLQEQLEALQPDLIIGTSMGAMYAEQMHGHLRILVNPSFQMARLLTFGGMGRMEFRNKRADGAKDFKIDKDLINEFKEIEKNVCQDITPADQDLVYGLFGTKDKRVNCQSQYLKAYGKKHFQLFDGDHYLNDKILHHVVLPLVRELLKP